jgi:hypothetical protein
MDEVLLERDCIRHGVATYRERRTKLEQTGFASLLDPETHLIKTYIDPVARGLVEWISRCRSS